MTHSLGNSAECEISGEISTFATWTEDIYFFDPDGAAMDISDLDFQMQFRADARNTSADVTLSIDDATLSIESDSGAVDSILRINAESGTFSSYVGDMICDLIAIDSSDNITHYAHGVVTFRNDPVSV